LQKLKKFAPLLVLILGLAAFFVLGLDKYVSEAALREHRADLGDFVARNFVLSILLYCLVYSVSTALSLPGGALLTLTGGFLFGSVVGTTVSVIGATIGASLLFLAARTAFGDMLRTRAGSAIDRMRAGFQENALSYLLFLRLIPAFPFFLVNLVPAFLNVRFSTYVIGTFIGIIPGTAVFALVGSGLGEIFDRGEAFSLSSVFTIEIMLGLSGLAVLALLPVLYKKMRRNPEEA